MTPTAVLPATPATPASAGRGKQAKHVQDGADGAPAFGSALAMLLGGNVPGLAQGAAKAAEQQGAPAPSSGVTETAASACAVSVVGSGSLTAAVSGAVDGSVAATGAAAPSTSTTGAAAPGAASAGTAPGATTPFALHAAGEPVAAGLRGITPASAKAAADGGRPHAPSIAQLPPTARPARSSGSGASDPGASDPGASDSGAPGTAGGAPTSSADLLLTQPAAADVAAIAAQVTTTAATSTTSTTSDATTTTTVLRQVFPQVTQVATTPGTHRISITLHPESLGEVKVTVVVRAGGDVHVRLAADAGAPDGALARQALLQGAPELHRLLAGVGGDVKVVVQGGATGQPGQSRPDSQTQSQAQQSPSQGQAQAQSHADEGRRGPSYTAENPQNLPPAADLPIGATTTTTAPQAARAGQVDEHAGRLDRLM